MARRYASPGDFQLVGMDQDPTPGDADLIQGIMRRYQDIGDAAEKALNVLKKDGAVAKGRGAAMDKLNEKVGDDLPEKLSKTMTSYHDAAQAYTDYMPRLREAQDTFDRAVDQAREAAPQAGQAPPQLAQDATDDDKAQARRAQDAIDDGRSRLNAAKGLAEQARSMRESAQRQCEDVLDRAAREAIPERNIFQKIGDFFKDFPFVQVLLGLLIAAVSVFFPIAGALLGGVLFSVTQIGAIASGNFSLGEFLTGLAGLVPGGSLLKAGGAAAEAGAGAGAVAKLLPAGAKASGGSIRGIGSAFDAGKKVIGPLADSTGGKIAGEAAKEFGKEATKEAAGQVIDGQPLDLGDIAKAGAFGAGGVAAGAALRGIVKKAGAGSGTGGGTPETAGGGTATKAGAGVGGGTSGPAPGGLGAKIGSVARGPVGEAAKDIAKEFGTGAVKDAAEQTEAGEPLDFGEIAEAGGIGALGAVGGAAVGAAATKFGGHNAPAAQVSTPGGPHPAPPASSAPAAAPAAGADEAPLPSGSDAPPIRTESQPPAGPDGVFTTGLGANGPARTDAAGTGALAAPPPGGLDLVDSVLSSHVGEAQHPVAPFPVDVRPPTDGAPGRQVPAAGPLLPNPNFRTPSVGPSTHHPPPQAPVPPAATP